MNESTKDWIIVVSILLLVGGCGFWIGSTYSGFNTIDIHDTDTFKHILCGYAYGYLDHSGQSEHLNQTELMSKCI